MRNDDTQVPHMCHYLVRIRRLAVCLHLVHYMIAPTCHMSRRDYMIDCHNYVCNLDRNRRT